MLRHLAFLLTALAWSASNSAAFAQPPAAIDAHVVVQRAVRATCIVVEAIDPSRGSVLTPSTKAELIASQDDYAFAIFQGSFPPTITVRVKARVPDVGGTGGCTPPLIDSGPVDSKTVTFPGSGVLVVDLSLTAP